jgi:hypothetical protein
MIWLIFFENYDFWDICPTFWSLPGLFCCPRDNRRLASQQRFQSTAIGPTTEVAAKGPAGEMSRRHKIKEGISAVIDEIAFYNLNKEHKRFGNAC